MILFHFLTFRAMQRLFKPSPSLADFFHPFLSKERRQGCGGSAVEAGDNGQREVGTGQGLFMFLP